MKHRVAGRRLDRTTEHRTAMFRNQVASLLRHERIHTTTPKAKELKRIFDKVVTLGKKGTPHARRVAFRDLRDAEMIEKLFGPIAERYAKRSGGYTRIIRTGKRHGDNADMAYIELVDRAPAGGAGEGEKAEAAEKPAKAKKSEKKATDAEKAPKAKAKKAKGE
ncbi:MAG TPA: 50S ribosomal protein L17 [Anaeromyxobacteraceae bacterium]|nr:50S ribosomal protein L17 [Anaeromyxobacteraceae bacterium]